MAAVLKAEDISIRYITGDFKDIGIKEFAVRKLTGNYHVKEFMAVDGVSFELEEGDMLGIIGSNGAGKSTLLKAIAGIMEPTHGKITAHGDIAALLELGSGFDGDLTVKENAYLRGAMLGYTKEFMDSTYDQIVDFAELREFEDRPFKQLSSGMKSRLAFSIASLVKPDILILDEVLSVGDGAFQEKSAKKMREIISQGATTILVSHSLEQIRELCNKVLWLDHGRQIAFGETQKICDQYESFLQSGLLPAQPEAATVLDAAPQPDLAKKPNTRNYKAMAATVLSSIVLGAFASMITLGSTTNVLQEVDSNNNDADTFLIYSETSDRPVTYRGAAIGDNWYSPSDTVLNAGNWSFDWEQVTYTATDDSPLEVRLPKGSGRTLTFNAGPDQGVARVTINDETIYMDCYNETTVALGLPHNLMDSNINNMSDLAYLAAIIAFVLVSLAAFLLNEQKKISTALEAEKKRELWGDLSRIICCGMIVLLHNTCNTFNDYAYGRFSTLFINCLTAFAVPCFFMLSGAYLLRRTHSIRETVIYRVPKTFVPVLFWGMIYIFVEGDIRIDRFLMLPFQQSTAHLWFMYSLFGIYMLLPLLSKIYQNLSFWEKLYLLGLLTLVPMIIYDGTTLSGKSVPIPKFALLWPELGLFFCGGILWDLREKIKSKGAVFYGLLFLGGLAATIVGTIISSAITGSPSKSFISTIGSTGNVVMAGSVICLTLTLDCGLTNKLPKVLCSAIHRLGKLTMGIYFIHMLFLIFLNNQVIPWLPLHSNTGSMVSMIGSAFLYFCLSAIICLCAKRVRGISKLF